MLKEVIVNKDSKSQKFVSKHTLSHRIYKINDEYQPVSMVLDKKTEINKTVIKDDRGKTLKSLHNNDYTPVGDNKFDFKIPKDYHEYPFLTIEREIKEYGHEHWISLYWQSLTPIDGITYTVTCKCGIIKDYFIFDDDDLYDEPILDDERKHISIKSSQWLYPYTGICLIIADKSDDDEFDPD